KQFFESNPNLKEVLLNALAEILIFIINFLNYFLNIGINIIFLLILFFRETFHGTNRHIKYTKPAHIFIKIQKRLYLIKQYLKELIKIALHWLNQEKRKILLVVFLL